jgi:hypothetical protein
MKVALFIVLSAAAHAACNPDKLVAGDARLRAAAVENRAAVVAAAIVDACGSDLPADLRIALDGDRDVSWQTIEQFLVAHGAGKQRAYRWAVELSPTPVMGGIGIVGSSKGGGGTGEGTIGLGNLGIIGKRRTARAADGVNVRGSVDKATIRKVVQDHIDDVRLCSKEAVGTVNTQFTIGGTGQIIASVVLSSTIGSHEIEQCIVAAVKSWTFPKPAGGGIVIVNYPFVLK